jgi:hypothetical protein
MLSIKAVKRKSKMDNKRIVIYGGGTVSYIRNHLALCAPAYGGTARRLAELAKEYLPKMDVDVRLTKMAGGKSLETNEDISKDIDELVQDDTTKIVIMSAALCDFNGQIGETLSGKYAARLKSRYLQDPIELVTAGKVIRKVREKRKDIFLVGFKTTTNATPDEQYLEALNLCKKASCNLVVANDTVTRFNMIVTPEESRYAEGTNRDSTLRELLKMAFNRTHLTFTRSTVVAGDPVSWDSEQVPPSLRTVVNYCIEQNAYKPFNGVTAGHFACKINDTTFLTSIRKTNFNDLAKNGLVKIVTDGPDTVLAYGAKPSVGGQSQRIVFHDHPDVDCIVHFHCPKKASSQVPSVSQKEFECGSHECGHNTSKGLKKFGNLYAVYLDNHGPNIVFNQKIDPNEVIRFIEENFDLSEKTGGFVSIKERLATPDVLNDLVSYTS